MDAGYRFNQPLTREKDMVAKTASEYVVSTSDYQKIYRELEQYFWHIQLLEVIQAINRKNNHHN